MRSTFKTVSIIVLIVLIIANLSLYVFKSMNPDLGNILSSEQCKNIGGTVIASPGYPVYCENGTKEIGSVPIGDEGAICCK
jgi:hypothetical protein